MSECVGYGALISQLMEGVGNGLFSLAIVAMSLWFMDRRLSSGNRNSSDNGTGKDM